jgi:hypothetical protein
MFAELQEQDEELWAEARCKSGTGDLVALFYSEQLDDIAKAKAICAECPVRPACLDYAIQIRELHGIWGGLNELERKQRITVGPEAKGLRRV